MKKYPQYLLFSLLVTFGQMSHATTLDPNEAIPIALWAKAPMTEKLSVCQDWLEYARAEIPQLVPRSYATPFIESNIQECVRFLDDIILQIVNMPNPPVNFKSAQDVFMYNYSRIAEFSRP